MKLQYKNNKLANFSMKSSITVDTNPEDIFLEISFDESNDKRIKSIISQLRNDQLDEITKSANSWINTKPSSSDEVAVIDGAKKFMKVYNSLSKRFSLIVNKINQDKNFSLYGSDLAILIIPNQGDDFVAYSSKSDDYLEVIKKCNKRFPVKLTDLDAKVYFGYKSNDKFIYLGETLKIDKFEIRDEIKLD